MSMLCVRVCVAQAAQDAKMAAKVAKRLEAAAAKAEAAAAAATGKVQRPVTSVPVSHLPVIPTCL